MTTSDKRKKKLINDLKNKEFRDVFVEENINVGISFQIRKLRKDRGLTQKKLGKLAAMKQERISVLENPNYSGLTIDILKRLASAFDVGLLVKFVPFSTLVKSELRLTSESLCATSFNDDQYFQRKNEESKQELIETSCCPGVTKTEIEGCGAVAESLTSLSLPEVAPYNTYLQQITTSRV